MTHIKADRNQDPGSLFEFLSKKALEEETVEGFIECLAERTVVLSILLSGDIKGDIEIAALWLKRESEILRRLEKERQEVFRQMEELSRSAKALRGYTPRYPLPMNPVFFDQTG
jgi:hypothetical protein